MLKYLIILLDDTSTSFCHYTNDKTERRLVPLDNLRKGILWAMKENLMVQFVYPDYELPSAYKDLIDTIDHVDIAPCDNNAHVSVYTGIDNLPDLYEVGDSSFVLRLPFSEFINNIRKLGEYPSLNIVLTDIEHLSEADLDEYKRSVTRLSNEMYKGITSGKVNRINIITDRLQLSSMNNCNAGYESITLAPDGKFYICPAFYMDGDGSVGSPVEGLDIPNPQLYRLSYSPICRICDAYHCKRCVWLNKRLTQEVNTPGRQQCIVAHHERNATRELILKLRESSKITNDIEIPEIDYIDPFEKIKR